MQKTMLTDEEVAARTGVAVATLANWRVQRNRGADIGPRFVKLGPGRKAPVRYLIQHVAEWEAKLSTEEPVEERANEQNTATRSPRPEDGPEGRSRASKTMLTPKELSDRIGIRLQYLSNWRVRRNAGEDIGPRFVKLGDGSHSPVRYALKDVEEWESTRAARDCEHPASTVKRWEW